MKPIKTILLLIIIFIIATSGYIFFSKDKPAINSSTELVSVKVEQNSLNIIVDPRIELLSSIQLNSDYYVLTKFDTKYKNDMENYFSEYKNHKAVKQFKSLSKNGFRHDAPPAVMLYYSNPPILQRQRDLGMELKFRAGGGIKLNSFIKNMNAYSIDSDFASFYNSNYDFYKSMSDEVAKKLEEVDLVKDLEDYYGIKQHSYNIVLAPIFHYGGYGMKVKSNKGGYDIYGIIGPVDVREGIPQYEKEGIIDLVWHEFGHSFVNPVTSKHKREVNKYSMLYGPIRSKMKDQAYSNWETCVNEHIIRAVVARLFLNKSGEEAYDKIIKNENTIGFIYIEDICKKLEEYENNRSKYKTFEEFYPEIINTFKSLSGK